MYDLAKLTNDKVGEMVAPDHFPTDITMNLNKMKLWLEEE